MTTDNNSPDQEKPEHTLLLVDDEESITNAIERLLRREGHDVYTAAAGPKPSHDSGRWARLSL